MTKTVRFYCRDLYPSGWKFLNWGIQVDPNPVVHLNVCEAVYLDPVSDINRNVLDNIVLIGPKLNPKGSIHLKNIIPSRNPDGTLHVDFYVEVVPPFSWNFALDVTVFESAVEGFIVK
ncbi:hypothetical protein [Bacillus nitratireducens]|uniref:hypothetical protein n=1 Tax=Bacillus nitratireducens TaxID=2026193 RepID=UPI0011A6E8C9|nr:hypothetical protein [Bacillus nitratireducens]